LTRRSCRRFAPVGPAGRWTWLAAFVVAGAAGCSGDSAVFEPIPTGQGGLIGLETVATGLERPLLLTAPPGDDRLFIAEQPGQIRIVKDGSLLPAPYLDIRAQVRSSSNEQGLLGFAFHPDYASNGFLYVSYTFGNGDSRVERYTVSPDPDRADPASALTILETDQPAANHNGGLVTFGPDGMLYVGLGDGGGAGDPFGNGQDPNTWLGAILRIDVDGGDPYVVPADNPFVGQTGARPEIWAYGLRNPWRFAFDRESATLFVADVGQSSLEEINAAPASAGGLNYGWNVMEGSQCFGSDPCDRAGLTLPVFEYDHSQGCSVTGGFVYRGGAIADLQGLYLYSDFCSGFLRSFRLEGGEAVEPRSWPVGDLGSVLSFGEDAAGELYVLTGDGRVRRLARAP
jgi:glucose/arabinose dehydrogenase